jgi:DnaJ-class molecular chaperone
MECPACEGNGEFIDDVINGQIEIKYPCGYCNKRGKVNIFRWLFWKLFIEENKC